jgi:hypothetical protein
MVISKARITARLSCQKRPPVAQNRLPRCNPRNSYHPSPETPCQLRETPARCAKHEVMVSIACAHCQHELNDTASHVPIANTSKRRRTQAVILRAERQAMVGSESPACSEIATLPEANKPAAPRGVPYQNSGKPAWSFPYRLQASVLPRKSGGGCARAGARETSPTRGLPQIKVALRNFERLIVAGFHRSTRKTDVGAGLNFIGYQQKPQNRVRLGRSCLVC